MVESTPGAPGNKLLNNKLMKQKRKNSRFLSGIYQGLGIGIGLLLVVAAALFAQSLETFQPGDLVSSSRLNTNFSRIETRLNEQIAPIGGIVAWHKNLAGGTMPPLPAGWMECNGGTVTDPASPLLGATLPDLNGQGRFLRGSSTSGTDQGQMFQDHAHYRNPSNVGEHLPTVVPGGFSYVPNLGGVDTPISAFTGNAVTGSFGTETRPINMSVVWVMRIK